MRFCGFCSHQRKKVYSDQTFTPEAVRKDENYTLENDSIFHGGRLRKVQYKEVTTCCGEKEADSDYCVCL